MCSICKRECKEECCCPRCPFRNGKLRGYPPCIQSCSVCGLEDDRDCNNEECALTEHFIESSKKYCQLCYEKNFKIKFTYYQIGMYCSKHKKQHQQKMNQSLPKL